MLAGAFAGIVHGALGNLTLGTEHAPQQHVVIKLQKRSPPMTNRDPYENPNFGRPATEGLGTGTIAALVIVAILVVGGVIYGMSSDSSSSIELRLKLICQ